jgi:hypothetical protein
MFLAQDPGVLDRRRVALRQESDDALTFAGLTFAWLTFASTFPAGAADE